MSDTSRPCDAFDRILSFASARPITEFCTREVEQIGTKVTANMTLQTAKLTSPVKDVAECVSIPTSMANMAELAPGQTVTREFSCTPNDGKTPAQHFVAERSCAKDAKPADCDKVRATHRPIKPK